VTDPPPGVTKPPYAGLPKSHLLLSGNLVGHALKIVTLVWAHKLAIGEHYRIENDSDKRWRT
jgi:hypothetical protein